MKITKEWIKENGACKDGAAWGNGIVGDGMELSDLLPKFERADWMIWTLLKSGTCSRKQIVKLGCVCAKFALKRVPEGENCPKMAIDTTVRWCNGKAAIDEVWKAADYARRSACVVGVHRQPLFARGRHSKGWCWLLRWPLWR